MNITKDEFAKAIKERRIVFVGKKFTRNGWVRFDCYEIKNGELKIVLVETAGYYDEKHWEEGYYKCGAIGSNRVLEVMLSIGYALGLKFHELSPQVTSIL